MIFTKTASGLYEASVGLLSPEMRLNGLRVLFAKVGDRGLGKLLRLKEGISAAELVVKKLQQ